MVEERKTPGLTAGDKEVHVDLARALFFFERANPPEPVAADGKWLDGRAAYLKRSRRLMHALRKAGLAVAPAPPAREPAEFD